MRHYNYHPETGEYLGCEQSDESPLEPGVFLNPAHSTFIEPPIPADDKTAIVFNGAKWTAVPDYRGSDYWMPDGGKHRMHSFGPLPDGAMLEEPEDIARKKCEETRRQLYREHVDPLMIESAIKRAMGLAEEAATLEHQAIEQRNQIQAQHPMPAAK